ncbi:uncharacterized protein LOC127793860 [Diospyros lotus]|uniref:uncharacterized protein LOC127793860 n=1 Tax=Diospyros lotus TaxID=55363 RepID=UPI00225B0B05|nr:uncharacterized protein LOC127793860 [Diospyros lotus]
MSDESEKRFHAIMDKLFSSPKPKSKSTAAISPTQTASSPGVQLSGGKKRPSTPFSVLELNSRGNVAEGSQMPSVSGGLVQAPLCRPWNRGDLMRRLATFKSMTWFAKPQVASPVNCARRGWINVDVDTIACEACGTRLYFSTPSSWAHHQAEKAALVFSLKLDNGHKPLCPWTDNSCDDTLAQFPPTTTLILVDEYKKRSSALMHLLALPVISSSVIDYMRSPQLEHFLQGSSIIGGSNESADTYQIENPGNEVDMDSSVSYYQAQKLISLCGWEPRLLPYIVDCKKRRNQSIRDANFSCLSQGVTDGQNSSIVVYSSGREETMETSDDSVASGMVQFDPNSVVLDCKRCGATVGLWTFSTVPRPLELLRLVGDTELDGEHDSAQHKEAANYGDPGGSGTHDFGVTNRAENTERTSNTGPTSVAYSSERQFNLKLTIAGGPPPTKQNFKAKISMPVIGRNLRARFASDSDFRDRLCAKISFEEDENHRENNVTVEDVCPLDVRLLDGKEGDKHCDSTTNRQLACSDIDFSERGDALRSDKNSDNSSGATGSGQGLCETSKLDSIVENPVKRDSLSVDGSSKNDTVQESADVIATVNPPVGAGSSFQVEDTSMVTKSGLVNSRNEEIVEKDASVTVNASSSYLQQNTITNTLRSMVDSQDGSGVKSRVQFINNTVFPCSTGKDQDQLPSSEAMEFDPIRQHRHFCSWIASTGKSLPGWQQTLSALQRQKEFDCPPSTDTPSSSFIEVDDPLTSVKNLFMSPSAKKMKLTHGSS